MSGQEEDRCIEGDGVSAVGGMYLFGIRIR